MFLLPKSSGIIVIHRLWLYHRFSWDFDIPRKLSVQEPLELHYACVFSYMLPLYYLLKIDDLSSIVFGRNVLLVFTTKQLKPETIMRKYIQKVDSQGTYMLNDILHLTYGIIICVKLSNGNMPR